MGGAVFAQALPLVDSGPRSDTRAPALGTLTLIRPQSSGVLKE